MIRRVLALLLLTFLAVAAFSAAEPVSASLSASQTVGSHSFARGTLYVTVANSGATNTCWFRLFSDADAAANATTAAPSISLAPAGWISFPEPTKGAGSYVGSGATLAKASYWKSISYICSTGQTTTFTAISQ